jgi:hypothetical protein
MKKLMTTLMVAAAMAAGIVLPAAQVQAEEFDLQKADLNDRMTYHRAIDAAVWAMPLMNFKFYRDALADAGVGPGDVGYFSRLQDWRFQTATPNNTTPYILTYWNFDDGPVVLEMPASVEGIGVFGTIMDAWQRPIDDVGAVGRDGGRGAKYLLVPPDYDGELLPNALVYEQETYNGWVVLRPIMAGGATEENLAKATALTKQLKVYPLAKADAPPKMKFVDLYGKLLEMTPKLDGSIYREIHEMIEEEVVLDRDLSMMGLLARIGIKKGEPFKPDAKLQAICDQAGPEALQYMIGQYHRALNPFIYEGKKWSALVPNGSRETEWSYEFPSYYDYHQREELRCRDVLPRHRGDAGRRVAGRQQELQARHAARRTGPRLLGHYHLRPGDRVLSSRSRTEQHRLHHEGGQEERRWFGGYLFRAQGAGGQGEQLAAHGSEATVLPARPFLRPRAETVRWQFCSE